MSGRIRTVKPEWLEDESIVLAGMPARIMSVGLILLADDYGNGRANPALLRARVFPTEPQSVTDEALQKLEEVGYIELYEKDGQSYFHIRNWKKHQRVDKPGKPRVPGPPSQSKKRAQQEEKVKVAYFMRSTSTGLIKIGESTDPVARLVDLAKCSPEPLELLAVGGKERELHRELQDSRVHGEWFRASRDVLAKIREYGGGDEPIATAGYEDEKRSLKISDKHEKIREGDGNVPDTPGTDHDLDHDPDHDQDPDHDPDACGGLTPPPRSADGLELVTPPLPAKRKPKQPTASSETWAAYAEAYRERYGCDPIRNAKINGQLSQFVQRVPRDEAPQIVRHYLRSHNARYTASGHSVGCLLQDAEKLRTEALTGRATTSYAARQADAKQGRGQKYAGVIAKLEREAEEEERQAREVSSGNA